MKVNVGIIRSPEMPEMVSVDFDSGEHVTRIVMVPADAGAVAIDLANAATQCSGIVLPAGKPS